MPKHRPDIIVKEINTDQDHIHLLVSIPPTESVGTVVRLLKSNTAKALNDKIMPIGAKMYESASSGANEAVDRG